MWLRAWREEVGAEMGRLQRIAGVVADELVERVTLMRLEEVIALLACAQKSSKRIPDIPLIIAHVLWKITANSIGTRIWCINRELRG